MRSVSAGLAAHLAGEVVTLATLWKATRRDGLVFGFTDHDQDIVFGGLTYAAATGYTRTAVRSTLGLAVDNLDIEGALDAASIATDDLRAGLWDFALLEISLINWADTSMGVLKQSKGMLGRVRDGRSTFVAEVRGLTQYLGQSISRIDSAACDANLGDTRCQIVLASYTVTGTITGVTSRRVFADSARGEASAYFDGGKFTFTSGANNGLAVEIKTHTSPGQFAAQLPFPYDVQIGDTYSVHAGCDKAFATCVAKFANAINYQGLPHLPGTDRILRGVP